MSLKPPAAPNVPLSDGRVFFNVQSDFGASNDGATLARSDIQEAINAAGDAVVRGVADSAVVYLGLGTYLLDPVVHPHTNSRVVFLVMRHGVTLKGAGKAATILKLEPGFSKPLAATGGSLAYGIVNLNSESADPVDEDMNVEDLTLDGQASTQSVLSHGIFFARTRSVTHERVRVKDCFGNDTGPPGETFHFETEEGADTYYNACEVVGTSGSTATGFSADSQLGVHYTNCVARGMSVTHGFTNFQCAMMTHTNCHAYSNGASGFNTDSSEAIQYAACIAGGRYVANGFNALYTTGQTVGNHNGFTLASSVTTATGIDLLGCSGRYNDNIGLFIQDATDGVRTVGGAYLNNGVYDIGANSAATHVNIGAGTRFATSSAAGTFPAGMFDVKPGSGDQKIDTAVALDGDLTVNKDLLYRRNGNLRWILRMDASAEPGSNAGSDLTLRPRDDAGAGLTTSLTFLRRTSLVQAGKGFVQATKAGVPVDGDFATTPPDGTTVLDTTDSKLYVRTGGAWKSVTLA